MTRQLPKTVPVVLAAMVISLGVIPGRPAQALPITGTGSGPFDQVAMINALGGTVTQVGGSSPGKILTTSTGPGGFVGSVSATTGVNVSLPAWRFASQVINSGSFPTNVEPGNTALPLLNAPTDLTFTAPGPGGPDGNGGDGSVRFDVGNYVILGFGGAQTIGGATRDFIVFTNTAGGGQGKFDFLNSSGSVVASITATLAAATAGSGSGGLLVDFAQAFTFSALRVTGTGTSGHIEVDAVAVQPVPEPTTLVLLGSGLLGLGAGAWKRSRRGQRGRAGVSRQP